VVRTQDPHGLAGRRRPRVGETTAERAITRESVSSLKLLRLDSAVSANDLVQDFISDQLPFNGTVLLVLGQPALAREHVRLRALRRCSTRQTFQSINQSINQINQSIIYLLVKGQKHAWIEQKFKQDSKEQALISAVFEQEEQAQEQEKEAFALTTRLTACQLILFQPVQPS